MRLLSIAPPPPTTCAVCHGPSPVYDRFVRRWFGTTTLVKVCASCAALERVTTNHVVPAESATSGASYT